MKEERIVQRIIQRKMFEVIMGIGGTLTFEKSFPGPWPVKTMRAVTFTEKFDIDQIDPDYTLWNSYVGRIREAIGSDYNSWIGDGEGNMIGIMAFYDANQCEIKMKHFDRWSQLYKTAELIASIKGKITSK